MKHPLELLRRCLFGQELEASHGFCFWFVVSFFMTLSTS